MSDQSVKRWWIAPKLINPIDPVEPSYFYAYDLPGDPKRLEIEVMEVSEHERVVAELKAEINRLTYELDKSRNSHCKVIAQQKRVIEKLTEQRNRFADCCDRLMPFDEAIQPFDAEIAAIERGKT